jgi:hypothetical protein
MSKKCDVNDKKKNHPNKSGCQKEEHKTTKGWGACYKCNCREFEGWADLCSNCGHSFSNHHISKSD